MSVRRDGGMVVEFAAKTVNITPSEFIKEMEKRGCVVDGPHVYINNVLRLTSLKDEEWLDIFKEYYNLVSLSYFAWPGEEKETRRLFVLKRK